MSFVHPTPEDELEHWKQRALRAEAEVKEAIGYICSAWTPFLPDGLLGSLHGLLEHAIEYHKMQMRVNARVIDELREQRDRWRAIANGEVEP